jgi:hypothetical protein
MPGFRFPYVFRPKNMEKLSWELRCAAAQQSLGGSVVVCDDMLSNHFVKVLVSLVYFVCSRIVLVSPRQSPHTESTNKQNKIVRLSRRVQTSHDQKSHAHN